MIQTPELPHPSLLQQQAEWLAPARARLLRRVAIARLHRVLDMGTGYGAVIPELVRRSGGQVIGLDLSFAALASRPENFAGSERVCSEAEHLPFQSGYFDLVFSECALMWMEPEAVLAEVYRILQRGGSLVALEPDYGGMIEQPPAIATRDLWIAALKRAGAEPTIGRKLPGLLEACGFQWRVELISQLHPPSAVRFRLLEGLPLTKVEKAKLDRIRQQDGSLGKDAVRVAHLPFFFITATKPVRVN